MHYTYSTLLLLLSYLLCVFARYKEVTDDCVVIAIFCLLCYLFCLFLSHFNGNNCLKDLILFSTGVLRRDEDEDSGVIENFCY